MAAPKKRSDAEKDLKAKGFTKQPGRGKGSHEVWKDSNGNSVTVPNHGKEIAAGTWRSIERQTSAAQQRAAEQEAAKQAKEAQRLAGQGIPPAGSGGRSGSAQQGGKAAKKPDRGKSRGGR
ncbi:type II toxin-antitoxin system HicA family toxin [Kribbella sp. NPDC048915]|uniref:type II toxin-antitoxin system HicA family toxin n=1 Tax=Kribbella sp. NPDC048915 TaxID=3155148 RepID=UPI0033FFC548